MSILHTHRFHLQHKWIALIAVVLSLALPLEAITLIPSNINQPAFIPVLIVEIGATLLLAIHPPIGAWLVAAAWLLTIKVPSLQPSSFTFVVFFALAVIAYCKTITWSFAITFATLLCYIDTSQSMLANVQHLIVLGIVFLVCALIGVAIRKGLALREENQRIRQTLINEGIAAEMHDTLCNDLSRLHLKLQSDASFMKLPEAHQYLDDLLSSMNQSRRIISLLEHDDSSPLTNGNTADSDLTTQANKFRDHLQREGYNVVLFCNIPTGHKLSSQTKSVTARIIKEFQQNVVKHAAQESPVYFSVTQSPSKLVISLADTPQSNSATQDTHTGIQRLNKQLAAIGGEITTQSSENTWSAMAIIPLSRFNPTKDRTATSE